MDKCEKCIHSRLIVSENGYHHVCCLSPKVAVDCMLGKKSQFITLEKDESDNIKVAKNTYKIWDYDTNGDYVEMNMPVRMQNFLDDIKKVCEKHNLSISHEDYHGAFMVEDYDEYNIKRLFKATKEYKD